MEYRHLGRTGIRVSPLCLGTMMFGGPTKPQEAQAIFERAVDAGINFVDTANVYQNGRSEEVTGAIIRRSGLRDHLVLATKCHGNMFKEGADGVSSKAAALNPNRWGNSRRQIIAECERSLKRLDTDWIDLYQIHRPHLDCPIDETLRALDDLVRSGKVRYIGCSTFAAWQVVESLWVSERLGLNRFVTEQPPYNLLDRRIERELIPASEQYGLGILPWSPLAGGFLTGKYRRGGGGATDGRFSGGTHARNGSLLGNEKAFDMLDALEALAHQKACTVGALALAWCRSRPGVTSPIIGPRTLEQLEENLKSLAVDLSPEDHAAIDRIVPPGSVIAPFYEASFGPTTVR